MHIKSWRLVFLVEETEVPRENHQPAVIHWQTWSHNVVLSTPHHERDWNPTTGTIRSRQPLFDFKVMNIIVHIPKNMYMYVIYIELDRISQIKGRRGHSSQLQETCKLLRYLYHVYILTYQDKYFDMSKYRQINSFILYQK